LGFEITLYRDFGDASAAALALCYRSNVQIATQTSA
jgi:hypothetical protein